MTFSLVMRIITKHYKMPGSTQDEFLGIIESNKGIIYKIANSYCRNTDDRNDLVQEIILQIWRAFDSYSGKAKYSTWIYRIALNVAISYYRKESRRRDINYELPPTILEISDEAFDSESDTNIANLQKYIRELKEIDRALMLLYLDEKSYKEMAEILGISPGNVATKINRIKNSLKQKFSQ